MGKRRKKEVNEIMPDKRRYLWVDQVFYDFIMNKTGEVKKSGFKTGSADLTKRITPLVKEHIDFKVFLPQTVWKRKNRFKGAKL